jgi:hypothetical protein
MLSMTNGYLIFKKINNKKLGALSFLLSYIMGKAHK